MNRFGFDRMVFLARFVHEKRVFTMAQLEEYLRNQRLMASRKTIQRDIEHLRNFHSYQIEYDFSLNRYHARTVGQPIIPH